VHGLFPEPVLTALSGAPDKPAIEQGDVTVSRGELLQMARRAAGAMHRAGLRRGVGVGVLLPLTPQAYAAHLAAHALGCRVAPARPAWGPEQLAYALTKVDVVVAERPLPSRSRNLPGNAPPESAFQSGLPGKFRDLEEGGGTGKPTLLLSDLLDGEPLETTQARPEDPARMIFTSGSTGRPKACVHSYRAMSLAYQEECWPEPLKRLMHSFSRCLVHQNLAAPVQFTYLGRCLVAGGVAVLSESPDEDVAEAIERLRPTATMMHPARLHEILQSDRDLSSLEALLLGGSPASPTLLEAARHRLGDVVWQGYGQGEAGIISMLTPDQIAAGHGDTVGRPVPDVELQIRQGVIHVRSPHMMDGYFDDREATEEVLRDGWLDTRDVGFLDEHGLLHLVGRSRDVIMVNAEVCYAGAIEQVLASHPLVAQAFAVGAPDPLTGEAIHAFVVPVAGQVPDETELRDLIGHGLSANSQPKVIRVIDEVPLTEAGKPDKTTLRARITAATTTP
jgi:fatty-acyl-CoA synthase